jgi:hypothetical protein
MTKEEISKKTIEVISDPSSSSNSELLLALDVIQKDFETVKDSLIKLTHHLDNLEETYNKVLKEYNSRNGR